MDTQVRRAELKLLALGAASSDTSGMSAAARSWFTLETSRVSSPFVSDVRSLFPRPIEDGGLTELQDRFIEAWAKMTTSFAMNRTLGRVHALIYIAVEPVDVDTISVRLGLPREHCADLVEELVAWGLVREVESADTVARFEAEQDPWSWFLRAVRERHGREFQPLQRSVREVLEHARQLSATQPGLRETFAKVERFSRFIDEVMRFIDAFVNLGAKPMAAVLKTVAKLMPRGRSF